MKFQRIHWHLLESMATQPRGSGRESSRIKCNVLYLTVLMYESFLSISQQHHAKNCKVLTAAVGTHAVKLEQKVADRRSEKKELMYTICDRSRQNEKC